LLVVVELFFQTKTKAQASEINSLVDIYLKTKKQKNKKTKKYKNKMNNLNRTLF